MQAAPGMLPPSDLAPAEIVPWFRLEPGTRAKLICCSTVWMGAQTHWAEGRMKIHTSPTCRWCDGGLPIRFYFFLHLTDTALHRQYIVQLAPGNMRALTHARDEWGSLRGAAVELARRSKAMNSPTVISFSSPPFPRQGLPEEIDIREKLRHATNADDAPPTDIDTVPEVQP